MSDNEVPAESTAGLLGRLSSPNQITGAENLLPACAKLIELGVSGTGADKDFVEFVTDRLDFRVLGQRAKQEELDGTLSGDTSLLKSLLQPFERETKEKMLPIPADRRSRPHKVKTLKAWNKVFKDKCSRRVTTVGKRPLSIMQAQNVENVFKAHDSAQMRVQARAAVAKFQPAGAKAKAKSKAKAKAKCQAKAAAKLPRSKAKSRVAGLAVARADAKLIDLAPRSRGQG